MPPRRLPDSQDSFRFPSRSSLTPPTRSSSLLRSSSVETCVSVISSSSLDSSILWCLNDREERVRQSPTPNRKHIGRRPAIGDSAPRVTSRDPTFHDRLDLAESPDERMLRFLGNPRPTPVSRPKSKPKTPKQRRTATKKSQDNENETSVKKRSNRQSSSRSSKIQKVDGKLQNHSLVDLTLSDDDFEVSLIRRVGDPSDSQWSFDNLNKIKIEETDSAPLLEVVPSSANGNLLAENARLKTEIARLEHAERDRLIKMEQAHRENEVEKINRRQSKEYMEKQIDDLQMELGRKEHERANEIKRLTADLLEARNELNQLREKYSQLSTSLVEEKNESNGLRSETLALQIALEEEKSERAKMEAEQAGFVQEINNLKSATIPSPLESSASPAPSISEEQARLENVRKMYAKVKTRYDNIYSIAKDISANTRGMALGNFGKFGALLRQLKAAVEDADGGSNSKAALRID